LKKTHIIGLSRTGTTSVTNYLNERRIWVKHYPSYEELLNFRAEYGFSDIPAAVYFKDIDKIHKGSKFVLTHRSKEKWVDSVLWKLKGKPSEVLNKYQKAMRVRIYGSADPNREELLLAYDHHLDDVRNHFKNRKHDLLEIDIFNESPENLCKFLDIKFDDKPFPHDNKRS